MSDRSCSPAKVAFVFSGGAAIGAVQVGQVRALIDAGVRPDVVIGCSVGAINGAFVASHPDGERMESMESTWRALRTSDIFPRRSPHTVANLVGRRDHLCNPDGLRRVIHAACQATDISQLPLPLHVVTTDLDTRKPAWWVSGDPLAVIAASATIPGVFPPVVLGGHRHIDGGVVVPVPVQRALDLAATDVFVFDVSSAGMRVPGGRKSNAISVVVEAFNVARCAVRSEPIVGDARIAVLPIPDTAGIAAWDFSQTSRLIEEGYDLTSRWIAELKEWKAACENPQIELVTSVKARARQRWGAQLELLGSSISMRRIYDSLLEVWPRSSGSLLPADGIEAGE